MQCGNLIDVYGTKEAWSYVVEVVEIIETKAKVGINVFDLNKDRLIDLYCLCECLLMTLNMCQITYHVSDSTFFLSVQ